MKCKKSLKGGISKAKQEHSNKFFENNDNISRLSWKLIVRKINF